MFDSRQILSRTDVRQIEISESLPSTSDRAIQLIREEATEYPLLVVTQVQTAGRGTQGRSWHADQGSLTFTYCLPIESERVEAQQRSLPKEQQSLIPLTTAIAICSVLESSFAIQPRIKWPNDVLIGGRKVAGILSEKIVCGISEIAAIGIGINVSNPVASKARDSASIDEPDSIAPTRVSDWTDPSIGLQELLIRLLNQVSSSYSIMWKHPEQISSLANARLHGIGQRVKIQRPESQTSEAEILGIELDGSLRIRSDRGTQTVVSGRLVEPVPKRAVDR